MGSSELSPHFALLGFLYLQPMHGYNLHKQMETHLREVWHISQSQAYTILKRIEKEGLVSALHQEQKKRPARACFSLTPQGRACFEAWLYRPTPGSARALRVEFLTRLFFASQMSEDLAPRLLEEQAAATRADLLDLSRRMEQIPSSQPYNRLGIELRARQLTALLDWMDTCDLNQQH